MTAVAMTQRPPQCRPPLPPGVVAASVVVSSPAARADAHARLHGVVLGGKRKAAQDREDEMLQEYDSLESKTGGRARRDGRVEALQIRYGVPSRTFHYQVLRARQRREQKGTKPAALPQLAFPAV